MKLTNNIKPETVPQNLRQQKFHVNEIADTSEDYYRAPVAAPFLDFLIWSFEERFLTVFSAR